MYYQFSQASLQDYVDCPKRFQLKYIKKLTWPAPKSEPARDSEKYLLQGSIFHKLVQQYLIGISPQQLTQLVKTDERITIWWENFLSSFGNSQGFSNQAENDLFPEVSFSTPIGDYRLIGKYDLLVITKEIWIIYDWKTTRKQPKREWIETNLQSLVYPYLLVKAGATLRKETPIQPSQVTMVYWFANFPTSPIQIQYNEKKIDKIQRYLEGLVNEITVLDDSAFNMTQDIRRCRFCTYRSYCNRGAKAGPSHEFDFDQDEPELTVFDLDLDQIAEIEF